MLDAMEAQLTAVLAPLRARLTTHPLYGRLRDERSIRTFMETHVFAVWDFQSLLKALQRLLTCVEVPWLPTSDSEARRLVNEIVLDEESDSAPGGGHLSHFELYVRAMRESGANITPISAFLDDLRGGSSVDLALDRCRAPHGASAFVRTTMAVVQSDEVHRIAAAFAFGREEIIPTMFRQLVARLAEVAPGSWGTFQYYLDRHIGTDADRHGPQSRDLVRRLCGEDVAKWSEATESAKVSLEARLNLWGELVAGMARQAAGTGV